MGSIKRSMDRRAIAFAAFVALAAATPARPQSRPLKAEEISASVRIDSLTIPTPGEFFAAMDAAGRPAWGQQVRSGSPSAPDSRPRIALILGTLVADGYVAVEAQDGQAVKNIGKEIISLAKKLNVNQSVLGRAKSINDFAENSDWNALREELEATQNEVKLDMAEQKDDRLVTLVTTGAWIRGVEIVSGIVAAAYTQEGAKLLRQPAIIEYLIDQLDSLPAATRDDSSVKAVREGLKNAVPLISAPIPSAEQVQQLHGLMKSLDDTISKGSDHQ